MQVQNESVPSKLRPVPLRQREDLVTRRIEYQGVAYWVVKDPIALKYHRLQAEQYHVLQSMDGKCTLEQLRRRLREEFPTSPLNVEDVQRLVSDLHEKGLVNSDRFGQGESLVARHRKETRKKLWSTFTSLLYLRLPGWDPERVLQAMYPWTKWVFRPWAVFAAMSFVVASWVLLLVEFDTFRAKLPEFQEFFGWPNLIYLWITIGIAKILHEFGHGLSCKHFGGECHEMGVMMLVFMPTLYCDVTDSWLLKNKWKRIAIGGAGMYVELVLSAFSLFLWWFSTPGLFNHLCLNVFLATTISTVIFNANPLMRLDGYYMMSDFLEIPNLRAKSDRLLRDTFAKQCLGIEPQHDPFMPQRGHGWFVTYAIASAIYRYVVLFGITLFLYTVLKPYGLQSIGITLAIASIGGIVFNMLFNLYRMVTAPRTEKMSATRITVSLTVLAGALAAAAFIPLPLYVESAFMLEPNDARHVLVATPGRIVEIHAEPDAEVEAGETLLLLVNEEKEDRMQSLVSRVAVKEKELRRYVALEDHASRSMAAQELASLKREIKDVTRQLKRLTIVAPESGRIVPPPPQPEPKLDPTTPSLTRWHGTPIDAQNVGATLDEQTHVVTIAPNDQLEAVMLIDQSDRNDLFEGQKVQLKFDHLPMKLCYGTVAMISNRHLEFAPPSMSNKYGGELPTVTDEHGRQKLTSIVYQAVVTLDEPVEAIRPGMRGRARFLVSDRSAASWLWRAFRETFNFRL